MMLKLYDTYKKSFVNFEPLAPGKVSLYTCGPTVYDYAHIGNLRTFLFEDILKRTLILSGFDINHTRNITDVGHLTSDVDEGEDKLEKGAAREHKSVWEVAEFYTEMFIEDAEKLNLLPPNTLPKATDHIAEMIAIVEELMLKGIAYETNQAIYFDITKFPKYESLTGQKLAEKLEAARQEVITDSDKHHPADFALWFKRVGRFSDHTMHWSSPWGDGFPGWHIECSAMSRKYLGQPFDIHTGGIDHATVHHPNEIAQSEAAFETPLSNFWLHAEFLTVDGKKMSKSLGNLYTISDLEERGYTALDFRYLVLNAHYQSRLNFTWESLESAKRAYNNLKNEVRTLDSVAEVSQEYMTKFSAALAENINAPQALSIVWDLLKDNAIDSGSKRATINQMDQVLGLNLADLSPEPIPEEIATLVKERDEARQNKDWAQSDKLRQAIEAQGFVVEDSTEGTKVRSR